uniref:hypothetical protein n=1 Tax=Cellulomonas sp. URHD0024 TaxID=1302620 RepID=UPI0018CB9485
ADVDNDTVPLHAPGSSAAVAGTETPSDIKVIATTAATTRETGTLKNRSTDNPHQNAEENLTHHATGSATIIGGGRR